MRKLTTDELQALAAKHNLSDFRLMHALDEACTLMGVVTTPCGEESLIDAQIDGLLEGDGAGEDHQNVLNFFQAIGFTEKMASRIHHAIVNSERKPVRGRAQMAAAMEHKS